AFDRREHSQCEGDRVRAGSKVFDFVLTRCIGHDGPALLDKDWTRGFDRDTWQHCARRVLCCPGDRRLREGCTGSQRESKSCDRDPPSHIIAHLFSPVAFREALGFLLYASTCSTTSPCTSVSLKSLP